jgi:ribonuclease BN (tRNA processing enzyme)
MPDRGAAGYLVIAGDERMMLDCGPGSTRKLAQAGCALNDLDRVMVSHFHTDHVNDLAAVIFGSRIPGHLRTRPLELVGPVGLKNHYEKLVGVYGKWIVPEEFELKIFEMDASLTLEASIDFKYSRAKALAVAHSHPSIGYRIETEAGAIVYSGDTDYCDSIIELCKDAALAVLECSSPDEEKIQGHLTPGLAGKIASAANVKHLVLTHFYPVCYGADILGQCRRAYQGEITLAEDLMRFTLS